MSTLMEERALALLGSGHAPAVVAASIGCSESFLSQLLSREDFAAQVAQLRYESLAKHNQRDASYDNLEDDLIEKLRDCLPLMHRPMEILKAIQVINQAKRRGSSTPEALQEKQTIVNLIMPTKVIQQFTTNIQNQVIKAGNQELLTIQSGSLSNFVKERKNGGTALIDSKERVGAST